MFYNIGQRAQCYKTEFFVIRYVYYNKLEMLARGNQSSLLQKFGNYKRKKLN
jgi:hypothetical protein